MGRVKLDWKECKVCGEIKDLDEFSNKLLTCRECTSRTNANTITKAILSLCVALILVLGYVIISQRKSADRKLDMAREDIVRLKLYNQHLENTIDTLGEVVIYKDMEMDKLEQKADSLANLATLPMPCEHELELRKEELVAVRGALVKCKESKAIQTTRLGLSEIRVENQVAICDKQINVIEVEDKKAKRKTFLKGMGVGGLLVGILVILAL